MTIQTLYAPPAFEAPAYNCPHCTAYAHQHWNPTFISDGRGMEHYGALDVSTCSHCKKPCIWFNKKRVYPGAGDTVPPNPDMPEHIKADFSEAASILQASPRGSAALLRLCVQKLCKHLGEKGRNINDDIGALVGKGLPAAVQQALDAVRVIGNEAVHPGQIDLRDDTATASALFRLVNFICEKTITEPKEVAGLYALVPDSKRAEIERRDAKKE